MAVFSPLIPVAESAFGLQLGLARVFVPRADDRFYDLSGAAGFVTTALVSVYYPFSRSFTRTVFHRGTLQRNGISASFSELRFAPRQMLLTSVLFLWSVRLGSFLARRAIKAGGDSRFKEIKHHTAKFTAAWVAQGAWIFIVGLPVWLSNAVPASAHPPLRLSDYALWLSILGCLALEVTADRQKSEWRKARDKKEHDEDFISSGLWARSRHPNYVGEVGIWTGMWALAAQSCALPWQAVLAAAASPVFTYVLTRYVSGVPLLERASDEKLKDDPKWKEYKRTVPVFFPWGGY
ncbi:hypothetical protein F5I97DRAFT_1888107 [Phlebopus sp. FC_14]|nr:hypothetical protein F5I97DRAFT_1888107 [Phlebopus sp. FC_14]